MRQAEIHQLHVAGGVDHMILRLDVAMHDTLSVGFAQAVTNLLSELDALAGAERVKAIQHAAKAFAFNKFHGDEGAFVGAVEIVNAAYILVRDFPGKPQFVLEAFQEGARSAISGLRTLSATISPVSRSR